MQVENWELEFTIHQFSGTHPVAFHIQDYAYQDWKYEVECEQDDIDWAIATLNDALSRSYFTTPGTRNDSAVDTSIALHMLGCMDTIKWFDEFFRNNPWFEERNVNAFRHHLQRVEPYLEEWGGYGNEGNASNYAIDY